MTAAAESPYRAARRAFIAACEARGADVIGRVHPALRAPDGKPLFLDSAALGPRDAVHGVLLIATEEKGAALLGEILRDVPDLPPGARLVLVQALATGDDPAWRRTMLQSVATEDLSRVASLAVLALEEMPDGLEEILAAQCDARVTAACLAAKHFAGAGAQIRALLAQP